MSVHTYEEHGFKAVIHEVTEIGDKFKGIREGKPFMQENEVRINLNNKLHKVEKVEFFDDNEKLMKLEDVDIDTDVCVRGVLVDGDKALLLYREKDGDKFYIFQGGHKTVNETEDEAIIRETEEEVGYLPKAEEISVIHEKNDEWGRTVFYLINVSSPEGIFETNPDEVEGEINRPVWLTKEELEKLDNVYPLKVHKKIITILK